jgi:hypothetical protein
MSCNNYIGIFIDIKTFLEDSIRTIPAKFFLDDLLVSEEILFQIVAKGFMLNFDLMVVAILYF